jgi:hypothetical protein
MFARVMVGTLFPVLFTPLNVGIEQLSAVDALSIAIVDRLGHSIPEMPLANKTERWIITTPNSDWIPQVFRQPHEVRARKDGRYGMDDFTLHPQRHTNQFFWSCVIRKRSAYSSAIDTLNRYWWTPERRHFISAQGSAFGDIGKLDPGIVRRFEDDVVQLSKRVERYRTNRDQTLPSCMQLNLLETNMRHSLWRLKLCPGTFQDLVLSVAYFQRTYLDVLGWLDFAEIYHQRIMGATANTKPFPVKDHLLGAWTTETIVAQKLFLAGIPVWLLRAENFIPEDMNIVKSPIHGTIDPGLELRDWTNIMGNVDRYPCIFIGESGEDLLAAVRYTSPTNVDRSALTSSDGETDANPPSNSNQLVPHRAGTHPYHSCEHCTACPGTSY